MSEKKFEKEMAWADAWNRRQGQALAEAIGLPIESQWHVLTRGEEGGEEVKLRLILGLPRPKVIVDVPRSYADGPDSDGLLEEKLRESLVLALEHTRDLYQGAIRRLLEQPKPTQPAAAGVN